MIGARVGNWYLEAELGRGSHGTTYRARGFGDPERRSAVKVLTDPALREPSFVARFPAEMLTLQRLDHPNIARFFDSGTHGGLPFFATELVEGRDGIALVEAGKCPWRDVLGIAVQLARALKHGHNRNVLHRDLKPAHVMITADGTVKLLGFGLARIVTPSLTPLPPIGTAAFLPPESTSGKPLTRRSDFYSLGGLLYTLITGRPPFAANTLVELTHKQCYSLPERPGLLVRDLPPEFDEFICSLLDKNPSRRPASAQNLLDELDRLRGKLERKGEKLDWPVKLVPDTAEMAALPSTLGTASQSDEGEREPRPLLSRPAIVIPLFLVVLSAIIAIFAWPQASADELWTQAAPLVASNNPEDWDKAWDEYLEPLERKYPKRFQEEVANAKTRIRDRKELRRAVADGAKIQFHSEAERGYTRALRLAQAGDTQGAKRLWNAVIGSFRGIDSEQHWVDLAQAGLAALAASPQRAPTPIEHTSLEAALKRARVLTTEGKVSEAEAVYQSLEELYRDDVQAQEFIQSARGK